MKNVLIFLMTVLCKYAEAQPLPAGPTDLIKSQLISEIKDSFCLRILDDPNAQSRRSLVTSESHLLRFYPQVGFDFAQYRFGNDVTKYLKFYEDDYLYYIYNGMIDTLVGIVIPNPTDSCYFLDTWAFGVHPEYFKILAPVLSKIDLKTTSIFMLPARQTKVYLLINRKVFVIDDDKIVPFQQYFQSRYTIKAFREEFDGRM